MWNIIIVIFRRLQLYRMGCTDVRINGVCWSFKQPNGNRWAGGSGAVKNYIKSGGFVMPPRRNPIRLEVNHVPIWTDQNGG